MTGNSPKRYQMQALAGHYRLSENLAPDITPRDYLLALHYCDTRSFPAKVGQYHGVMEARVAQFDEAGDHIEDRFEQIEAVLTLEAGLAPSAALNIPALAALPVFKVTITPGEPTLEDGEAVTDTEAVTLLVVPHAALREMVWDRYQINLYSLKAGLEAIKYTGATNKDWPVVAAALAQKAFGHAAEDAGVETEWPDFGHTDPRHGEAEFYRFTDIYYLIAFLELVKAGDIKIDLPASSCLLHFPEQKEDRAFVQFLDFWKAPAEGPPVSLEALKAYPKKIVDQINLFLRYRSEIDELREKRGPLSDRFFSQWLKRDAQPAGREVLEEIRKLYRDEALLQDSAWPLYAELARWAATHKERVQAMQREVRQVSIKVENGRDRGGMVAIPGNLNTLPAHFAAIPAGLVGTLTKATDQYGNAILRVGRPRLDLGAGSAEQEQISFDLGFDEDTDEQQLALVTQAELLFGKGGPRWLLPQGLVAVSMLYREQGGYEAPDRQVRIYANDFIDTMRPGQIARFRDKGRGAAFGHAYRPLDVFHAVLGVLARLTYESGVKVSPKLKPYWSEVKGFYLISGSGEDRRGHYTQVILNPNLHQFIVGEGGLPFMMTNTKAMFEHPPESLDYGPAAQLALEQLARTNLYKRKTSVLSDPQGGGFTRLKIANRFGLLQGASEGAKDLMKRLNRTLDSLGNAGVIENVKLDGRDKLGKDAFSVKVLIEMHPDYRKAYDLGRDTARLNKLEQHLQTPFAEAKAGKPRPPLLAKQGGRPKRA